MPKTRKLFILYSAGHAVVSTTSDNLIIMPRISQEESSGSRLNMTFIRNALKELAAISEGMDILFWPLLDSVR